MSAATSQLVNTSVRQFAWTEAVADACNGAFSAARVVVAFVGCASLVLGAAVLAHPEIRASLARAVPVVLPILATADFAELEVEAPAVPAAKAVIDPRQTHVVQYLARRYRVAEGATRLLVATAFEIGREKNLDPLLILSVVAIESSLNPFAESSMGAQGLMQVMTRVHAERFEAHGGAHAALDPIANMKVGSEILRDVISRGGSVERGLQLYVGAGNLPDDGGYGARVLAERSRLAMAAAGKVDAAIGAGRAPAPEPKPATAQIDAPVKPAAEQAT